VAAVAVGDVTGDGVPDVVTAGDNSFRQGIVTVLPGNGDGTLGPPRFFSGPVAHSVALADLDGDGVRDIVVGNEGGLAVLPGDGAGGFDEPRRYAGSSDPWGLVVADVNGDGTLDVLLTDPGYHAVYVLLHR
jgi:hypothetical protein